MLLPQHFSQQIPNGRLLLAIIDWQKNNFGSRLKLEPVTTLYIGFVVKNIVKKKKKKKQNTKNFTIFFTTVELANLY